MQRRCRGDAEAMQRRCRGADWRSGRQRWRTSREVGEWDRVGQCGRGGGWRLLGRPSPSGGDVVRRGWRLHRRHPGDTLVLLNTFVILAAGSPDWGPGIAAEVLAHARPACEDV
jgi:hypothetical protein